MSILPHIASLTTPSTKNKVDTLMYVRLTIKLF